MMTTNEMLLPVNTSMFSELLPSDVLESVIAPLETLLRLEGQIYVVDQDGMVHYGDASSLEDDIAAAIMVDGEVLGTVYTGQGHEARLDTVHYLAQTLSTVAVETWRRLRIGEEILERYDELNLIYDLATLISSHDLSLDEIMRNVLEETNRILHAEVGIIYLFNEDDAELRAISYFGPRSSEQFWQRRAHELALNTLYAYDSTQLFESGRVICAPLRYDDVRLGALVLRHEAPGRSFNANEVNLLTTLSHNTALFIHAARLLESLTQRNKELERTLGELQATRDDLSRAERLSLIGQTVGGLVHDMRNPLNIVMGYAGLLQEGGLSEDDVTRFASQIITFVNTFSSMAQEILDYARDDEKVELERVDLVEYMQSVEQLLMPPGLKRGAKIVMAVDSVQGYTAMVDRQRFARVFQNLVNNALDAIEDAGGTQVTVLARPQDKRMIEFVISDDGPGVPDEIVGRLFEPLTTTKSRGTGLGLAIVRRMVLIHNGEIRYEKAAEGGACFIVTIPQAAR